MNRTIYTLDADEMRVVSDLAHLCKNSKQNVGNRIRDTADSLCRIVARKRLAPPEVHTAQELPLSE